MPVRKPRSVNIADAKARLSELVELASGGAEIVISRHGQPRARLVPLVPTLSRVPGLGAGAWKYSPDFDAPLAPATQALFEEDL